MARIVRGSQRWSFTFTTRWYGVTKVQTATSMVSSLNQGDVRRSRWASQWRIDITAGVKRQSIYAGMLVAAIGSEDGSGNALNTILHGNSSPRSWRYRSDSDALQAINNSSVFSLSSPVRLEKCPLRTAATLLYGRRKNPRFFKEAVLRVSVDPPSGGWKSRTALGMIERPSFDADCGISRPVRNG